MSGRLPEDRGPSPPGLPRPRTAPAALQQHTPPRPSTGQDQESVALDLVRRALAADEPWLLDLRAQHGVGADAVDALGRFYELKAYGGAEPDTVQLTPAEVQRAMGNDAFFLVVSGLEPAPPPSPYGSSPTRSANSPGARAPT